jgi:hypothetical protein
MRLRASAQVTAVRLDNSIENLQAVTAPSIIQDSNGRSSRADHMDGIRVLLRRLGGC